MNFPKPQWNLAAPLLPPIFISFVLILFFPSHLLNLLMGVAIILVGQGLWVGLQTNADPSRALLTNFQRISLFGWLFLLGASSVAFICLVGTVSLSPEELSFEKIANFWKVTFPLGIGILIALIVAHSITASTQRKGFPQGKTLLCTQMFFSFSSIVIVSLTLSMIILEAANLLAHFLEFNIPRGFQLQTLLGSSLVYLTFILKRSKTTQFINARWQEFLIASVALIALITLLSFLTMPFAGRPISSTLVQDKLSFIQWKLMISGWWVGISTLITYKIIKLAREKSLVNLILVLLILSGLVYLLCTLFISQWGSQYFLALTQGKTIVMLITIAILGGTILSVVSAQGNLKFGVAKTSERKWHRDTKQLSRPFLQTVTLGCVLYWATGFSAFFVLLEIVAIPSLIFCLVCFCPKALQALQNCLRQH